MILLSAVDKNWNCFVNNFEELKFDKLKECVKEMAFNKVVVYDDLFYSKNQPIIKGCINICFSNNRNLKIEGVKVFCEYKELFKAISFFNKNNVFVFGSSEFVNNMMSFCDFAKVFKFDFSLNSQNPILKLDNNKNWEFVKNGDPYFENSIVYYFCEYKNNNVQKYNWGYDEPDLV